jgi:hypothetical protein
LLFIYRGILVIFSCISLKFLVLKCAITVEAWRSGGLRGTFLSTSTKAGARYNVSSWFITRHYAKPLLAVVFVFSNQIWHCFPGLLYSSVSNSHSSNQVYIFTELLVKLSVFCPVFNVNFPKCS